jgi:Cdc6-like AAA superfamily ATPase
MATADFTEQQRLEHERKVKAAFSPHSPINHPDFFSGRIEQIRAAADAITTPGLSVVIYGERGVGKTSLANILKDLLQDVVGLSRVNCAQADDFTDVVRRSATALRFRTQEETTGFGAQVTDVVRGLDEYLPQDDEGVSPDAIAELLSTLPPFVVLVIDEFDRLRTKAGAAFADMIKALSDRGADTTIVLVGVAEDISQLVANHASVERCLRQIQLPRMSDKEVEQIIDKGLAKTEMTVGSGKVKSRIVSVSQGFPHYAHLLAQNAARAALDAGRLSIADSDVSSGMITAVEFSDQTHRDLYHKAVTGTKKKHLWKEVVLACALAESDERGYFSSRAVQESLSRIIRRPVIQQTVAFHLGRLIESSRGPLLHRIGPERRYRYGFINPLMRPFLIMKGFSEGMLED